MATDTSSAASPTTPGSLGPAADRIRDSAKWLIASFAAVGAVLAAGLQLSGIGKLNNQPPDHRLAWAAVATGLVVLGVILAIGGASSIVTKSFITLTWLISDDPLAKKLRDEVNADPVLLAGFVDVSDLQSTYKKVLDERRSLLDAYLHSSEGEARDKSKEEYNLVQSHAVVVSQTVDHVLQRASFDRLRLAYGRVKILIAIGAACAAIGIGIFAWASNPPTIDVVPVVQSTPTEVIVHFQVEKQAAFRSEYPQITGCDLGALDAVVLQVEGSTYQLATVPTQDCDVVALIRVAAADATVIPIGESQATTTTQG